MGDLLGRSVHGPGAPVASRCTAVLHLVGGVLLCHSTMLAMQQWSPPSHTHAGAFKGPPVSSASYCSAGVLRALYRISVLLPRAQAMSLVPLMSHSFQSHWLAS
jgi:hypothetical protein